MSFSYIVSTSQAAPFAMDGEEEDSDLSDFIPRVPLRRYARPPQTTTAPIETRHGPFEVANLPWSLQVPPASAPLSASAMLVSSVKVHFLFGGR